jgi:hypothetical protein
MVLIRNLMQIFPTPRPILEMLLYFKVPVCNIRYPQETPERGRWLLELAIGYWRSGTKVSRERL